MEIRPGYFGAQRNQKFKEFNQKFGENNWKLEWKWGDQYLAREDAWQIYEDAYFSFLEKHPLILYDLIERAKDVYDLSPRDVESGLEYAIQQEEATHLQDIAIRRSVQRLGVEFQGTELLQVRGKDSPLYHLNPGRVPFHAPHLIERPHIKGWWKKDTIEDFYQSNKVVIAIDQISSQKKISEHHI